MNDPDLIGWVDKDGVVHVEHKDAPQKPDPVQRLQYTLGDMFAMLDRVWDER